MERNIMLIPSMIDLHIFLALILLVIFIYIGRGSRNNVSGRIFQVIILCLLFTTVTEAVAWVLVQLESSFAKGLLTVSLATSSLQTVAWVAYFDYKVYGELKGIKQRVGLYLIAPFLITVLSIINVFRHGFIFDISGREIHWSIGAVLPPVIVYVMMIAALLFLLKNREMIFGRLTQTLLVFILLPVFGSLIQFFVINVPVNWAMYTLAIVITFILVELTELHKDELTNLPTRRQFENRLKFKLKKTDAFGIMMIDLNDFKMINDTKGHQVGDIVLQQVADILITSINPEDMACRVGGDEFTVIIESSDRAVTEMVKNRIEKRIEELNQKYSDIRVGLSIGLRMVNSPMEWDYNALLTDVDRKMYKHKQKIKNSRNNDN